MGELQFFKSFLNEWLAIERGVFVRPAIYYGSHLGNMYQMYMTGQDDGFSIENPHPTFGWEKGRIEVVSDQKENRVLIIDGSMGKPVFSPAIPHNLSNTTFHFLPKTRVVFGFWGLKDLIVCWTGLKYYGNDKSTIHVYVGTETEMKPVVILDYPSPKIVTDEAVLDTHLKTFGGYAMQPLDIKKYTVTETEERLTVKKL